MPRIPLPWDGRIPLTRPLAVAPPLIFHEVSASGGHTSHNGVVTAISLDTKKCLDAEIMSDKCKACQKWQKNNK